MRRVRRFVMAVGALASGVAVFAVDAPLDTTLREITADYEAMIGVSCASIRVIRGQLNR
jgi:hypothetical protein